MDSSLFQCLLTFLFFRRKLDGLHGNVKLPDEIQIHFNLAGALAVLVLHGFMDDDFFHELTQHFIGIFRAVAVALNKRHKPFDLIFAGLNFIQLPLFFQNRFFKLCLFAFILGRQRIEPFLRDFFERIILIEFFQKPVKFRHSFVLCRNPFFKLFCLFGLLRQHFPLQPRQKFFLIRQCVSADRLNRFFQ